MEDITDLIRLPCTVLCDPRYDQVETSHGCFALRIRTWKSGRAALRGGVAAQGYCPVLPWSERKAVFTWWWCQETPFSRNIQRGAGSGRPAWVHILLLGLSPGMVLGSVCSVLSEDKRNHFVWIAEIGEDSGHVLSLGFCGGGNQLVASGLDFLTSPVHVTGRVSFLCHLSYTKSCSMG